MPVQSGAEHPVSGRGAGHLSYRRQRHGRGHSGGGHDQRGHARRPDLQRPDRPGAHGRQDHRRSAGRSWPHVEELPGELAAVRGRSDQQQRWNDLGRHLLGQRMPKLYAVKHNRLSTSPACRPATRTTACAIPRASNGYMRICAAAKCRTTPLSSPTSATISTAVAATKSGHIASTRMTIWWFKPGTSRCRTWSVPSRRPRRGSMATTRSSWCGDENDYSSLPNQVVTSSTRTTVSPGHFEGQVQPLLAAEDPGSGLRSVLSESCGRRQRAADVGPVCSKEPPSFGIKRRDPTFGRVRLAVPWRPERPRPDRRAAFLLSLLSAPVARRFHGKGPAPGPRIGQIFRQIRQWRGQGRGVALATVVRTWGSSPRPAGSHLAVDSTGQFVGSVSGGCIEAAVINEAQSVIGDGRPRRMRFGVSDEQAWEVAWPAVARSMCCRAGRMRRDILERLAAAGSGRAACAGDPAERRLPGAGRGRHVARRPGAERRAAGRDRPQRPG